ncbi:hypothetical protein HZR84_08285 [Hyphobacterium sp. CCMP332]|nr:hypothetical protein HZR84_08285 [Hyphobacterium sp. CCMP332]
MGKIYYIILSLMLIACNESSEGDPEPEFTLENELQLSEFVLEEIIDNPSQYGTVVTESEFIDTYLQRVKDSLLNSGGLNNSEKYNWNILLIDDSMDARIFAVPGGKIFLSSATILLMQGESELASLMAREMSYVNNGLALEQIINVYGIPLTLESFTDTNLTNIPAMTDLLINSPYTAENELKGDLSSVKFLCGLAYQSDALANLYTRIISDSTNPISKNFTFYPLDSLRTNAIIEESNNLNCTGSKNYFSSFQVLKDSLRKI